MRCDPCQGTGRVLVRDENGSVKFLSAEPVQRFCTDCRGSGQVSCCEGSERHGQLEKQ